MPTVILIPTPEVNFRIPQGDTRTLRFHLRRKGQPFSVAGAASIQLGWNDENHIAQTPVEAREDDPQSDWANGDIAVHLTGNDVLAARGAYEYALTVFGVASVPATYVTGTIESYSRPGYPLPTP